MIQGPRPEFFRSAIETWLEISSGMITHESGLILVLFLSAVVERPSRYSGQIALHRMSAYKRSSTGSTITSISQFVERECTLFVYLVKQRCDRTLPEMANILESVLIPQ